MLRDVRVVLWAAVGALACSPKHDADAIDAPRVIDARAIDAPPASDGPSPAIYGCADGTREGFGPPSQFPDIAACAGGWDGAGGLAAARTGCPVSGNDSTINRDGSGCAAADLCAVGWEICADAADAAARFTGRCDDGIDVAGFYATNQPTLAPATCGGSGALDLIGCSTDGIGTGVGSSCAPLEKGAGSACANIADEGWSCGSGGDIRLAVTKAYGPGGVLCCRLAL